MAKSLLWVLLLAAAPVVLGQQAELDRLAAECARLRRQTSAGTDVNDHFGKFTRPDSSDMKNLLRDWIESRLPANIAALEASFPFLEAQLAADLGRTGVLEPQNPVADAGYVSSVKLLRPAEYPSALMVQAGISVPCGSDVTVYLYHFTAAARTRLLEAGGNSKYGNHLLDTQFSTPDAFGRRIFYASWDGVQCASVWNGLDYRLIRIDPAPDRAVPLFSGTHSYVIDEDLHLKLSPEELLLELTAEAITPGFRRTHVLHYSIGPQGVQRIDPVALQPQDFVHEWLMCTWDEMQSRSSATLAKWHNFLHEYVGGDYHFVQPCEERPGITQVAVGIDYIGHLEVPEPLSVYFLVQNKGDHRYEMAEISFTRQLGCPGETYATYDNPPSLFKKN